MLPILGGMAVNTMGKDAILTIQGLKKTFPIKKGFFKRTVGYVKAVDGVSLALDRGETFGLVGESGCGKSTMARLIMRVLDPTEGSIVFDGEPLSELSGQKLRETRQKLQMVFQDPYASLNPKMTVKKIITEPYRIYGMGTPKEQEAWALGLLKEVGLGEHHINRFPHEFSGGQRQRIGIARALALKPKLLVCDEPVSALDVSVRAQVIKLMQQLQQKHGLTYIFISHDLSVVKYISHRVGVMYLGHLVEVAGKHELYRNALHPYTRALLSAIPIPNPERKRNRIVLEGDVPSPVKPPSGCVFHPRCSSCMDICKQEMPKSKEISEGHTVACHLV